MSVNTHPVQQYSTRSRWFAAMQLLVVVLALLILHAHHPSDFPSLPPCPSQHFLDIHCSGCGSTRATHFVLNGRIADAWRHNPLLLVVGIPAGAWYLAHLGQVLAFGRRRLSAQISVRMIWLLVIAIVLFTITRNLPLALFDGLRPPVSPQP